MNKKCIRKWVSYSILCVAIPAVVIAGSFLFQEQRYAWVSLCVAILSCIPFFLHFERGKSDTRRLILIAVMTALCVIGRFLFAPIPGFKPVTALVIITAIYFGGEAGYMTGALAAVISNFYFGQGPWTPMQMASWGLVGFVAGLLAPYLKKNKVLLAVYAVVSGVLYSMLMDVWTVLWADGYLNLSRYIATVASSAWFMVIYAVSNAVFLLLFGGPIGKILERMKKKYGL